MIDGVILLFLVQDGHNLVLGGFRVSAEKRRETLEQVFARFPALLERRPQLAATLSGGEQQMPAIGRALMASPRLLMLDEPSLGLAFVELDLRRSGVSILLVEQNARAALHIADRAYVMELRPLHDTGPAARIGRRSKDR